jgi:phage-related minor tail protein
MAQSTPRAPDFDRAFSDARKQAGNVAGAMSDAAEDVYGQARESAADVAGTANESARSVTSSFEKAIRHTVETQPYTAAAIALGIGWLLGRMHRPL